MRPSQFPAEKITSFLREHRIATLPELAAALGSARRTVFRKLEELSYRTSYSHRGSYYTIDEVAQFDEWGLWSHRDVWFSVYGTLLSTAAALVERAECGYFVGELDNILNVSTKDALRNLAREALVSREKVSGQFLYCAVDPQRRQHQLLARRAMMAEPGVTGPMPMADIMPDELRAAIVLFFSMLDEKQRRLYAGLEALKTGRGGDTLIAELLGLDVGTVARGRRSLLMQDVETERVRKSGGGRKPVEKKPGSHRENRNADGARDGRRSSLRLEVDEKNDRENRCRTQETRHRDLPEHRGEVTQGAGLLTAGQSQKAFLWLGAGAG